jgi:ADP-heptose:LPS heptosyltransferase
MFEDLAPVPFQNLLIIRPRFLGDIILATGIASAAKTARPTAKVTFLTDKQYADAILEHPDVDHILPFDSEKKNNPFYLWRFIQDLRVRKFDCVLDLFGNPRTAQWTYLTGASVRVGYRLRGRSWAYNRLAFPSTPGLLADDAVLAKANDKDLLKGLTPRRPVTEAFLDQWRALGYGSPAEYRTYLQVTGQEFAAVDSKLSSLGWKSDEDLVVLAPGASHPAKRWPIEKFIDLADQLASKGLRPLFVLGPKDQGLLPTLNAEMEAEWLLVNQPYLRELSSLIASARLLVSNDAGPMHVGPAVGTPTVGVFGPGEPAIWFPYAAPHQVAYKEVECSHCGLDECPRMECMKALTVEDVLEACRKALGAEEVTQSTAPSLPVP